MAQDLTSVLLKMLDDYNMAMMADEAFSFKAYADNSEVGKFADKMDSLHDVNMFVELFMSQDTRWPVRPQALIEMFLRDPKMKFNTEPENQLRNLDIDEQERLTWAEPNDPRVVKVIVRGPQVVPRNARVRAPKPAPRAPRLEPDTVAIRQPYLSVNDNSAEAKTRAEILERAQVDMDVRQKVVEMFVPIFKNKVMGAFFTEDEKHRADVGSEATALKNARALEQELAEAKINNKIEYYRQAVRTSLLCTLKVARQFCDRLAMHYYTYDMVRDMAWDLMFPEFFLFANEAQRKDARIQLDNMVEYQVTKYRNSCLRDRTAQKTNRSTYYNEVEPNLRPMVQLTEQFLSKLPVKADYRNFEITTSPLGYVELKRIISDALTLTGTNPTKVNALKKFKLNLEPAKKLATMLLQEKPLKADLKKEMLKRYFWLFSDASLEDQMAAVAVSQNAGGPSWEDLGLDSGDEDETEHKVLPKNTIQKLVSQSVEMEIAARSKRSRARPANIRDVDRMDMPSTNDEFEPPALMDTNFIGDRWDDLEPADVNSWVARSPIDSIRKSWMRSAVHHMIRQGITTSAAIMEKLRTNFNISQKELAKVSAEIERDIWLLKNHPHIPQCAECQRLIEDKREMVTIQKLMILMNQLGQEEIVREEKKVIMYPLYFCEPSHMKEWFVRHHYDKFHQFEAMYLVKNSENKHVYDKKFIGRLLNLSEDQVTVYATRAKGRSLVKPKEIDSKQEEEDRQLINWMMAYGMEQDDFTGRDLWFLYQTACPNRTMDRRELKTYANEVASSNIKPQAVAKPTEKVAKLAQQLVAMWMMVKNQKGRRQIVAELTSKFGECLVGEYLVVVANMVGPEYTKEVDSRRKRIRSPTTTKTYLPLNELPVNRRIEMEEEPPVEEEEEFEEIVSDHEVDHGDERDEDDEEEEIEW